MFFYIIYVDITNNIMCIKFNYELNIIILITNFVIDFVSNSNCTHGQYDKFNLR